MNTEHLRLAVCVPWTSEFGWTRSWKAIARLGFFQHPDNCTMELFGGPDLGDGWCSARRHNACLEQAVYWNADLILILGADQTYEPDMLVRLVKRHREGCDVVSANVNIRGHVGNQGTKPFQTICWRARPDANGNSVTWPGMSHRDVEYVGPQHGELVRIHGCGSGVLMFPASALKHIKPPWFYEEPVMPTFARKACADWPFVHRLQRDADLAVWCDTTIKVKHIHPFEIDETFSDRFADWEASGGDPSCCEKDDPDRGRIRQVRVSPSISFFDEKFRTRYSLNKYSTPFLPAFFFGCYTAADLKAIQEHPSEAVVIWAGTDALLMREALATLGKHPFGPNVKHIAISKFIADDLDALGITYRRLPLCCIEQDRFVASPRSGRRGIFAYLPLNDHRKYGGEFTESLRSRLPEFEWIVLDSCKAIPPEEMPGVYDKCFIGLRNRIHDGLSNSVIEMGLMGRRTLWPGDAPCAIPVTSSVDEAVAIIKAEYARVNSGDDDCEQVSAETRKFLEMPNGWDQVSFYDKPESSNGHANGIQPTMPFKQSTPYTAMSPSLAAKPYAYADYFDFRYQQGPLGAGGPSPSGLEAAWTRDRVMQILKTADCESVLDIGCGSAERWASLPAGYIGVDASPKAIGHAMRRFPDGKFLLWDATGDWYGQEYDAVISIDFFQHCKPADFAKTVRQVFNNARKLVIIKTSVDIQPSHYQFANDWGHVEPDGWRKTMLVVPESEQHGRMFIFDRIAAAALPDESDIAAPTGATRAEGRKVVGAGAPFLETT